MARSEAISGPAGTPPYPAHRPTPAPRARMLTLVQGDDPGDARDREGPGPMDPAVLERLHRGDPRTIEAACAEVLPGVRRLLFRLLGPRPEVDDATQDALLAFARALPRFEGRSSLRTLAHRISVRVAYRYFRRRGATEVALSLVGPVPDEVDPESVATSRETLRRLHRCLDRLPVKRRVAFILCCIEGLSPSEAADLEGTSAVTMRSRLMRARNEVTRLMKTDPYVQALVTQGVVS